jgi:Na+-translocating ferredoxin:NAD+ oxidoreductase RnfC subunit
MNTLLVESLIQLIQTLTPEEQNLLHQNLPAILPEQPQTSLEMRRAFLKKPLAERQQILAQQAESMVAHYQESSEWRELMAGDIIDA